MEPTILQMFSTEEILERIGQKALTGSLHVFNQRESANLFFKGGAAVAAAKGLLEGEEALRSVLDLKEPRYNWLPDAVAPTPPYRPIQVNLLEFLNRQRGNTPLTRKSAPVSITSLEAKSNASAGVTLAPYAAPSSMPKGNLGATTALPSMRTRTAVVPPAAPGEIVRPASAPPIPGGSQPGITKPIVSTSSVRVTQEEALLNRHRLVLVSVDNPQQRLRLSKISSLVGRNPACDIPLDHGSISRQHCLFQITDRGLHLKDLGTTNGTKVNGIAITDAYVNPGDKITMGHLLFALERE